jgi:hypothetical protein
MAAQVANEVKRLVYADSEMTPDAIATVLAQKGIKASVATITTYRSDFLNSMLVLRELGAFLMAAPEPVKKAKKAKAPSRAARWSAAAQDALEAIGRLKELQEEYGEWKDKLPENLAQSPVGEKLEAVCDLDLDDAESTIDEANGLDLPMGFGRD